MNQRRNRERLLAEVLAEEGTSGFREVLLAETLGRVRRQRRSRQAWRAASALALIAGLGLLVWRILPPAAVAPGRDGRGYAVLLSRPLPLAAVVITQPLAADRIVASVRSAEIVQTASSGDKVREIDDGELLALLGPKPAALVRRGPHRAELVFVNPEDEEELVRN